MRFDFSIRIFLLILLLSPFTVVTPIQAIEPSEWTATIDGEWTLTSGGYYYEYDIHHADVTFTVSRDGSVTGQGTGWEQFIYKESGYPQRDCDSGKVAVTFSISGFVGQDNVAGLRVVDVVPERLPCPNPGMHPFNNYFSFEVDLNDGTVLTEIGPPSPINQWSSYEANVDGYETIVPHGTGGTQSDTGETQAEPDYGGQNWDKWCKENYGSNYRYDAENNSCNTDYIDSEPDYGGYSNWDEYCKATYGDKSYYVAENNSCNTDYIDSDKQDSDSDSFYDAVDKCINLPEDYYGENTADGCPEKDSDGDNIYDFQDACPYDKEDFGENFVDGCPEDEFAEEDVLGNLKANKGSVTVTGADGKIVDSNELKIGDTIQTGTNAHTNVKITLENGDVINLQENTKLGTFEINLLDGTKVVQVQEELKPFLQRTDLSQKEKDAIFSTALFTGLSLGTIAGVATAGIGASAAIVSGGLIITGFAVLIGGAYFETYGTDTSKTNQVEESFSAYALDEKNQRVIFTPHAVLFPQGTEFTVTVEDGATKLNVLEGEVSVVPYDANQPVTTITSGNSILISDNKVEETKLDTASVDKWWEVSAEQESKSGGGCLIATATFGSELAPQVQLLREMRDNIILSTTSGTSFMTTFNSFYYSFSPAVADLERKNPVFKETIKFAITPLLSSLTLLQYVDIDTEQEMLGYGIGIILLNVGMYFVAPVIAIIKLTRKNRI